MNARFIFVFIFTSMVLCVCLLIRFYLAEASGVFAVKKIDVFYVAGSKSQELYWQDRLKSLEDRWHHLLGRNIWNVPISQMRKQLAEDNWIKTFQIKRQWPDQIEIALTSKKVIAIEIDRRTSVTPLSEDGMYLAPSPLTRGPFAPVLRSIQGRFLQDEQIKNHLIQVLSQLPNEGFLNLRQIDEVSLENGQLWFHLLKDKIKIRFGEKHLSVKIARVEKVLGYLKSQNITNRIIDAEFAWKVLVRPPHSNQGEI